jgi:hypothetical protein
MDKYGLNAVLYENKTASILHGLLNRLVKEPVYQEIT